MHFKIEQKFKDYRSAFRFVDVSFDSSVSFDEFVGQFEFIGITMALEDFKLIFNTLDFDQAGEIDFLKFCLINTDKYKDIYRGVEKLKQKKLMLHKQ